MPSNLLNRHCDTLLELVQPSIFGFTILHTFIEAGVEGIDETPNADALAPPPLPLPPRRGLVDGAGVT
jgi:hypothetical protein